MVGRYPLLKVGLETVWFRRVSYDIETTISKIKQIDQIMDFLGERLLKGR